ncbi:PfkB family carbohydrate kinase [Streptomyces sp. M10(2022)]
MSDTNVDAGADADVDVVPDSRSARSPAPGIVCFGESMVLVAPPASTPLREAKGAELRVAGAESNTAQYLADLGHRVAWVSRVGADPLGERIVSEISASGVDTRAVIRDPGAPTAVFFRTRRRQAPRSTTTGRARQPRAWARPIWAPSISRPCVSRTPRV